MKLYRLPKLFSVVGLLILAACNPPSQRARSRGDRDIYIIGGSEGNTSSGGNIPVPSPIPSPLGSPSTGSCIAPEAEAEFGTCNVSCDGQTNFLHYGNQIGYYNICRSATNPNRVMFQLQNPVSENVTIVPMTDTGVGTLEHTQLYIGEPRSQSVANSNNHFYNFQINRPGYQNYPLTSVMIIKDQMDYYNFPFPDHGWYYSSTALVLCMNKQAMNDDSYCDEYLSKGHFKYHYLGN